MFTTNDVKHTHINNMKLKRDKNSYSLYDNDGRIGSVSAGLFYKLSETNCNELFEIDVMKLALIEYPENIQNCIEGNIDLNIPDRTIFINGLNKGLDLLVTEIHVEIVTSLQLNKDIYPIAQNRPLIDENGCIMLDKIFI